MFEKLIKSKKAIYISIAFLVAVAVLCARFSSIGTKNDVSFAQFQSQLNDGKVANVQVREQLTDSEYQVTLKDGEAYKIIGPRLELKEAQEITSKGADLGWVTPPIISSEQVMKYIHTGVIVLLGLLILGQTLGITFMSSKTKSSLTMADVEGCEEAKAAMVDVVDYLRHPDTYQDAGARFPNGIILDGPPGTGKTLLAKAVAGEAGVNFVAVSGSDFSSAFVGMTGMRINSIFKKAKRKAPCVLFIDEIDAVGGKRLEDGSAAGRDMASSLNALLVAMDGFGPNSGVIVLGATNRINMLDPALLRSGRFDRHITMQLPNAREREQIVGVHLRKLPQSEINAHELAQATAGMSGADLANLCNQAALIAVKRGAQVVTTADALMARDRLQMGDPRPGQAAAMTQATKRTLSVHEVGHAITGIALDNGEVTRVSILPRGQSLGQTMFKHSEDEYVVEEAAIRRRITVLLGGRAAEMAVGKTKTTGAADDLLRASEMAMGLVARYGMGNSLLVLGQDSSADRQRALEIEANEILHGCLTQATSILLRAKPIFDEMVEDLLESEELDTQALAAYADRIKRSVAPLELVAAT